MLDIFEPVKIIKRNKLIAAPGPMMTLENIRAFKTLSGLMKAQEEKLGDSKSLKNFDSLSIEHLNLIGKKYGEEGLFKLQFLAMGHSQQDFKHFMECINGEFVYDAMSDTTDREALSLDNDKLPSNPVLRNFNIYFSQPSLSRKIYNPGRHHGYFVYGFGGPRILVSHPFFGVNPFIETYDIYANTIDLLTSLQLRGYRGTFLFLDYLPGLNYLEKDVPAWLHWFSVIAIHSDLVLFVKDPDADLREAQKLESEFTPAHIQKKIVHIPVKELTWAKSAETEVREMLYFTDKGMVTKEEWYAMEASHSKPFIDNYVDGQLPNDRYIKMYENGRHEAFPLDHNIYED